MTTNERPLRVSVFGLGYVGSVAVAALADAGMWVVGVDPNPTKRDLVASGHSPVVEEGVDELMAKGVAAGSITVTGDASEAVAKTDVSVVCVGTPSRENGSLDLSHVERVAGQIGEALANVDRRHTVIVRSTMLPGSTEDVVIPAIEKGSGRKVGPDIGVVYNPEFLREGSSIRDFMDPPFTVLGSDDPEAIRVAATLYAHVDDHPWTVPFRVAEMVKYASNAFHALKVVFANELGTICAADGMDGRTVMEIFTQDTKLNISPAYLRPGFAFGGSCLPKDVRALVHHARREDVDVPVLEAILPSNRSHVERALAMVAATGARRIGVLGFSFKAGTDDLRESPVVELIERLIGKGYELVVYDRNVRLANLQGSNREYIEREIPHIAQLMVDDADAVIAHGEVVIVGNADPDFRRAVTLAPSGTTIVDLVGIVADPTLLDAGYRGITW